MTLSSKRELIQAIRKVYRKSSKARNCGGLGCTYREFQPERCDGKEKDSIHGNKVDVCADSEQILKADRCLLSGAHDRPLKDAPYTSATPKSINIPYPSFKYNPESRQALTALVTAGTRLSLKPDLNPYPHSCPRLTHPLASPARTSLHAQALHVGKGKG
jgi:hypothetical protein